MRTQGTRAGRPTQAHRLHGPRTRRGQGWDAVTTRRLAERIEYSQPVLYSHFKGRSEIVGAVAPEGFVELATTLRAAVPEELTGGETLVAPARAYTGFAGSKSRPVRRDGQPRQRSDLRRRGVPGAAARGVPGHSDPLADYAGPDHPGLFVETFWAALRSLVTLTRGGRLPASRAADRLPLPVARFAPADGRISRRREG